MAVGLMINKFNNGARAIAAAGFGNTGNPGGTQQQA
eukprot:gene8183-1607_t